MFTFTKDLYISYDLKNRYKMEKIEKPIIIFYYDESKVTSCYVDHYEIVDGFVIFETTSNILAIPIHRILKIKRPKD